MVLHVILRQKTATLVKIFIWIQRLCKGWIAHTKARADDNTHVIHSQPNQSKKLNFLTWPDLAFGFVIKRSGYEIRAFFEKTRESFAVIMGNFGSSLIRYINSLFFTPGVFFFTKWRLQWLFPLVSAIERWQEIRDHLIFSWWRLIGIYLSDDCGRVSIWEIELSF